MLAMRVLHRWYAEEKKKRPVETDQSLAKLKAVPEARCSSTALETCPFKHSISGVMARCADTALLYFKSTASALLFVVSTKFSTS